MLVFLSILESVYLIAHLESCVAQVPKLRDKGPVLWRGWTGTDFPFRAGSPSKRAAGEKEAIGNASPGEAHWPPGLTGPLPGRSPHSPLPHNPSSCLSSSHILCLPLILSSFSKTAGCLPGCWPEGPEYPRPLSRKQPEPLPHKAASQQVASLWGEGGASQAPHRSQTEPLSIPWAKAARTPSHTELPDPAMASRLPPNPPTPSPSPLLTLQCLSPSPTRLFPLSAPGSPTSATGKSQLGIRGTWARGWGQLGCSLEILEPPRGEPLAEAIGQVT